MMYIHESSSIGFQKVFGKNNFYQNLIVLNASDTIQHPEYKEHIPPMTLRRMTDFVKMPIANGKSCCTKISHDLIEGIIVCTGLGSLTHTDNFMKTIAENTGGLLSPTSFILSTHNTAAGQLSLELGCKGYNNTHVQNSLSFEHGLIDALMCIDEGKKNILVGAVEESKLSLFNTNARINRDEFPMTYGSSFFRVDREASANKIKVSDTEAVHNFSDIQFEIESFLNRNNMKKVDISKVYVAADLETRNLLAQLFETPPIFKYEQYTGSYLTSSAFATHIAYDEMSHDDDLKRVLIVNNLIKTNLGLILLEKDQ